MSQPRYDDGLHPYMDGPAPGSMYDPHVSHRSLQGMSHHSPHMNHTASMFHNAPPPTNHVTTNHVMPPVNDVHKRDKDSIYGPSRGMTKPSLAALHEHFTAFDYSGSFLVSADRYHIATNQINMEPNQDDNGLE